jgi:hypothetical protein
MYKKIYPTKLGHYLKNKTLLRKGVFPQPEVLLQKVD